MRSSQLTPGLPSTDYYAPQFLVEVEGEELDPTTNSDVLELKVTMEIDNIASFDLTINNWEATRVAFSKYSDTDIFFKYSDSDVFNVGNRIHIMMGYTDRMLCMLNGRITSMTPHFPESGASTLTVSGLDDMFRLRDRKPTESEGTKYVNKTDWQIAKIIAERNDLKFNLTKEGEVHDEVVQKNQDDAQFLLERAKRIDFDCYILTDPESGEATLHFVKPTDCRDSRPIRVYQFRWGEDLINFNPTINLSHQVGKVTVRGWDPENKQGIVAVAEPKDLSGAANGGSNGAQVAQKNLPDKQEVVVDAPVTSYQEARDLAISQLQERAYEFITGTAQIIGNPSLRPGENVELKGLGKRFSGKYYLKKVVHTLGNAGYKTQFEVRQACDGDTQ